MLVYCKMINTSHLSECTEIRIFVIFITDLFQNRFQALLVEISGRMMVLFSKTHSKTCMALLTQSIDHKGIEILIHNSYPVVPEHDCDRIS